MQWTKGWACIGWWSDAVFLSTGAILNVNAQILCMLVSKLVKLARRSRKSSIFQVNNVKIGMKMF